jgi:hypothetical protein
MIHSLMETHIVLQALYSTLSASESASASGSRPQLTPAHAKAITDKIESLLGGAQLSDGASFNDQGQVCSMVPYNHSTSLTTT